MEKYIKYKRIIKRITSDTNSELNTQKFFDELIKEGWDIIYYNESETKHNSTIDERFSYLEIVVVVGKKQSNVL